MVWYLSVPEHSTVQKKKKNSPTFSLEIRAGSSKFNFMTSTFATCLIGLWLVCLVGFVCTWLETYHTKRKGSDIKIPGYKFFFFFLKRSTNFGKRSKNLIYLDCYEKHSCLHAAFGEVYFSK